MRQTQALTVMLGGANVFLTGSPGAGKTYVLNKYIRRAQRSGLKVAVTASTGIAASHIGGSTIHSWSGLGILDDLSTDDLVRLSGSDRLQKRYNATDILVIDEVSMLHGKRLDMVNTVAKVIRKSEEPFGGMQVILVGDLFQLPPVSRGSKDVDFVHKSTTWKELRLSICYLEEQHRQQNNDTLLMFLESMRDNELSDDNFEIIRERIQLQPADDVVVTRLYSHNIDVDAINEQHLAVLPGKIRMYEMETKGSKAKLEQLTKSLLVPEILELKIDAEVMFVANNFSEGFVNGSRGKVIGFTNEMPIVELSNGRKISVDTTNWSLNEDGKIRAEVSQLPLRLAWAITIHKSQGMSLDAAEIDLSRAFTPGMGYVALSRVRSIDGLYLRGINKMAFVLHPHIYDIDREFKQYSSQLAALTEDDEEQEQHSYGKTTTPIAPNEAVVDALKQWRMSRSKKDSVPPYIIAHNSTLELMAQLIPPFNEHRLLGISGMSTKKVEKYGNEIIQILEKYNDKK